MRRNMNQTNKKLEQAAKGILATGEQFQQFSNIASRYKDYSQDEIEQEMQQLINGFSKAEKNDLIKKLHILKQMTDILDNDQRKKVDFFIKLLSR